MQNAKLETGKWCRPSTGFAFLILHFAWFRLPVSLIPSPGSPCSFRVHPAEARARWQQSRRTRLRRGIFEVWPGKSMGLGKGKNCPGSRCCQGTAVIDPPGPGYPLLGCVPAKPNSISPGRNEFRSRLPAIQACRLNRHPLASDGPSTPSRNPIELPGQTSKNPSGVSPISPILGPDVHERMLGARFNRMNHILLMRFVTAISRTGTLWVQPGLGAWGG